MSDVIINNDYPGVLYEPTETTGTPVYHEDREVTLTSGPGSQMFRTYNAQFNTTTKEWGFVGSGPAYATVQNPDGSIHYFTSPSGMETWTTEQWAGSDNNTAYNAVDFGATAGGSGTANTAALAAMFAAMAGAELGGGSG